MNEFKFKLGQKVKIMGSDIVATIDMLGFARLGNESRKTYLVEWLNSKDEVKSRWLDVSELKAV